MLADFLIFSLSVPIRPFRVTCVQKITNSPRQHEVAVRHVIATITQGVEINPRRQLAAMAVAAIPNKYAGAQIIHR